MSWFVGNYNKVPKYVDGAPVYFYAWASNRSFTLPAICTEAHTALQYIPNHGSLCSPLPWNQPLSGAVEWILLGFYAPSYKGAAAYGWVAIAPNGSSPSYQSQKQGLVLYWIRNLSSPSKGGGWVTVLEPLGSHRVSLSFAYDPNAGKNWIGFNFGGV